MQHTLVTALVTAGQDGSDGGTGWVGPSAALVVGGIGAAVTLIAGGISQWLVVTGLAVAPPVSQLLGNQPGFELLASVLSTAVAGPGVLVVAGARLGTDGLSVPVAGTLSFAPVTFGGLATLLSPAPLTGVDAAGSGYGFAIRVQNVGIVPVVISVRAASMTVRYDMPDVVDPAAFAVTRYQHRAWWRT